MQNNLPEPEPKGIAAGLSVLFPKPQVSYGDPGQCLTDRHSCVIGVENTVPANFRFWDDTRGQLAHLASRHKLLLQLLTTQH